MYCSREGRLDSEKETSLKIRSGGSVSENSALQPSRHLEIQLYICF